MSDTELQDVDLIHVQNLQLPAGVKSFDIWGVEKTQPALVTLEIQLRKCFNTAASLDSLDTSTIHYGHLCKAVREACSQTATLEATFAQVASAIDVLGRTTNDAECLLSRNKVDLILPKASAYGLGVRISQTRDWIDPGKRMHPYVVSFEQLKVMTLVGVNAQERTGPQALLIDCEMTLAADSDASKALGLERVIVKIVEGTSFETLEALAHATVEQLHKTFIELQCHVDRLRLRFDKPSAVVFADAPAIEVRRHLKYD